MKRSILFLFALLALTMFTLPAEAARVRVRTRGGVAVGVGRRGFVGVGVGRRGFIGAGFGGFFGGAFVDPGFGIGFVRPAPILIAAPPPVLFGTQQIQTQTTTFGVNQEFGAARVPCGAGFGY